MTLTPQQRLDRLIDRSHDLFREATHTSLAIGSRTPPGHPARPALLLWHEHLRRRHEVTGRAIARMTKCVFTD